MFIRRTNTRSRAKGESYFTYRLVEAERVGKSVKQHTLLNLGTQFNLPQGEWPELAVRIHEILHGQRILPNMGFSIEVEEMAQRYAAQIIARKHVSVNDDNDPQTESSDRFQEVDLATLELVRPRSVGVEHAALTALRQLGFENKLSELGFTKPQIAAALGNIIGRMTEPGSELATYDWLQHRTALGDMIDFDYEGLDLQMLYRSADNLLKRRDALESYLFGAAKDIFQFDETITLYDLTNTYFEGACPRIDKAKRGRSKEKRSDCPLVTLGLVLDISGFPKRSRVFSGNVSEASTLETMLENLGAAPGSTVVMDAGIATEKNLTWLTEHNHPYIVVSRKANRQFDPEQAIEVKTAGGSPVHVQRVLSPETNETLLYCYSAARAEKDKAIDTKMADGYEMMIQKLVAGLGTKSGTKDPDIIREKLGRAKEKYARAAQHYDINIGLDEQKEKVVAITWTKNPKPGSAMSNPGVYCLRTTIADMDDNCIWKTYSMLTNLESVFRSLKTDLGLRPVYHKIERRVEGHLFISVLAYYVVHTLRLHLKAKGINESWDTLRKTLSGQVRITATVQRRDGRTVHIRKASRPEPKLQTIYAALNLTPNPGGTRQAIM